VGGGKVGVGLGCGGEDGDVDGDHFVWCLESGLRWVWSCVDGLVSILRRGNG
jgi:hypothetical protein